MTVEHGTNTAVMESRKQKLSGRGRGLTEPADVRIEREIAGKVGNSKEVVIGQTHRFGQVWIEMVVLAIFLICFYCCWFLALPFACLVHS